MVWKNNAFGIDVSSAQTGLDWSVVSADFAMIKMGETNRTSGVIDYDQQFAVHVQGAYDNNIPVGAYFVPDAEINGTLQIPLSAYRNGARGKDIEYSFIQKTLQNKAVQFIAIVFAHASADAVWNDANLEYLVNSLQAGMVAGEIQKMPIVLCANEDFVNKNFFYNKTNTFFDFVARHESDTLRVWSLSNTGPSVSTTWADVKNHLPLDTAKPTYLNSTKYQPLFWQFAIDKLPFNKTGSLTNFGVNISTLSKTALYTWMNFAGTVVPPVDTTCESGFHKDANGNCIPDAPPPVDHGCNSDQTWNETTQKCEDNVVNPPATGDFSEVVNKLNDILALLKQVFNRS
jgi:hypothetical protein